MPEAASPERPARRPALPFVAVGRVKDCATLAQYAESAEVVQEAGDVFKKLLLTAQTKLAGGQRTRLQWKDGSVCCLMDRQGTILFCVVTSLLAYPERLAYQLLSDLAESVMQMESLSSAAELKMNDMLRGRFRELIATYEDPNNFPQLREAIEQARAVNADSTSAAIYSRSVALHERRKSFCLIALLIIVLLLLSIAAELCHEQNRKHMCVFLH